MYPDGSNAIEYLQEAKVGCEMKACLFPVDEHTCYFTFLVMGYNASEVILSSSQRFENMARRSTIRTQGTGTWSLKKTSPSTFLVQVSQMRDSWSTSVLRYTVTLTRKPTYFYLKIFVPVLLIWMVNICAVILPADSGERISLLVTCFLAEIVYLDTVFSSLPETSDYSPLAVIFVFILLVFSALQIFLACLTSSAANGMEKASRWKHKFVSVMKKVLCLEPLIRKRPSKCEYTVEAQDKNNKEDSCELEVAECPSTPVEDSLDVASLLERSVGVKLLDRVTVIISIGSVVAVPTVVVIFFLRAVEFPC